MLAFSIRWIIRRSRIGCRRERGKRIGCCFAPTWSDLATWFEVLSGEVEPPELSHDERLLVKQATAAAEKLDWSPGTWRSLTEELKEVSGKKGRELFHPLRLALTGRDSGPEMAGLLSRMGRERAVRRLEAAARR